MEQVTAVGKGTTFFLLLVLVASASATSLNTTQQNIAITATSGKQVRRVWDVCALASGKLVYVGDICNTLHSTAFSLSTEKGHSVLSFEGLYIQ